jgi:hypothetical protein
MKTLEIKMFYINDLENLIKLFSLPLENLFNYEEGNRNEIDQLGIFDV